MPISHKALSDPEVAPKTSARQEKMGQSLDQRQNYVLKTNTECVGATNTTPEAHKPVTMH